MAGNPSSLQGFGGVITAVVPDPSAGSDWSLSVPAGEIWKIQLIRYELDTVNSGGDRCSQPDFVSDGHSFITYKTADHNRNETLQYSWVEGAGRSPDEIDDDENHYQAIPVTILDGDAPSGSSIGTNTENIRAGDQYRNIVVQYLKFVK